MPQFTATSIRSLLSSGQISTLLSVLNQLDTDATRHELGEGMWDATGHHDDVQLYTFSPSPGLHLVDVQQGRDSRSYRIEEGRCTPLPAGISACSELRRLQRRRTVH